MDLVNLLCPKFGLVFLKKKLAEPKGGLCQNKINDHVRIELLQRSKNVCAK